MEGHDRKTLEKNKGTMMKDRGDTLTKQVSALILIMVLSQNAHSVENIFRLEWETRTSSFICSTFKLGNIFIP